MESILTNNDDFDGQVKLAKILSSLSVVRFFSLLLRTHLSNTSFIQRNPALFSFSITRFFVGGFGTSIGSNLFAFINSQVKRDDLKLKVSRLHFSH